jgi:hypothetical protein
MKCMHLVYISILLSSCIGPPSNTNHFNKYACHNNISKLITQDSITDFKQGIDELIINSDLTIAIDEKCIKKYLQLNIENTFERRFQYKEEMLMFSELYFYDQFFRKEARMTKDKLPRETLLNYNKFYDSINITKLSLYLKKNDIGKFKLLPPSCTKITFLCIQHSSSNYFNLYSNFIDSLYSYALLSNLNYAQFKDRQLIYRREKQKYGTQFVGSRPWECISLDSVNMYRKSINLDSIHIYWKKIGINADSTNFALLKDLIISE